MVAKKTKVGSVAVCLKTNFWSPAFQCIVGALDGNSLPACLKKAGPSSVSCCRVQLTTS